MRTIVAATHPGRREYNEDCFAVDSDQGIGIVADGMGGYACGEVASALVKLTVLRALNNNECLHQAIHKAHAVVKIAASRDTNKKGMGSTIVALKMKGADYQIAWVGDSRAYLWDGTLKQITRDHSYVENLLAKGAITRAEAVNHPNKNLIMQAVGVAGENGLEVSVLQGRLQVGQYLLLCSDGLVDEVSDHHIAQLMSEAADQRQAVHNLIQAAMEAGGRDNITVMIAAANSADIDKPAIVPDVVCLTRVDGSQEIPSIRTTISNDIDSDAVTVMTPMSDEQLEENDLSVFPGYLCLTVWVVLIAVSIISGLLFYLL